MALEMLGSRKMVRFVFAAALCALTACDGVMQPTNEAVAAPEGADDAAEVVVTEWSERVLDAERLSIDDLPLVRWFQGECLVYGYPDLDAACPLGAYVRTHSSGSEIHLLLSPTLHESPLTHEVLHWVLDETTGDMDQGHETPPWMEVDDVMTVLRLAGL